VTPAQAREHAEFEAPAVRLDVACEPHRSALWRDVPYRRQVWIRSLVEGTDVVVVDDYGNAFATTVRAISPNKRDRRGSKEPRVWLEGHMSSYAAGRIFRPGAPLPVRP